MSRRFLNLNSSSFRIVRDEKLPNYIDTGLRRRGLAPTSIYRFSMNTTSIHGTSFFLHHMHCWNLEVPFPTIWFYCNAYQPILMKNGSTNCLHGCYTRSVLKISLRIDQKEYTLINIQSKISNSIHLLFYSLSVKFLEEAASLYICLYQIFNTDITLLIGTAHIVNLERFINHFL